MRKLTGLIALATLACALPLVAEVKLHGLFTDNMVIQRDTSAPVWGTADAGEKVKVSGSWGKDAETSAGDDGKWMVKLDTPAAGGPFTITVLGHNKLELKNVLSGDVWVCAGQSNMDYPLAAYLKPHKKHPMPAAAVKRNNEIVKAKHNKIRTIILEKQHRAEEQENIVVIDLFKDSWQVCDTAQITSQASAVGIFFGTALNRDLKIPIGLLDSNRGGSRAELWTSMKALGMKTKLIEKNGQVKKTGDAALYNGMIAPLFPFAIKGVIWYQGESNATNAKDSTAYTKVFQTMINCWRENWGQGDFPFIFVQLAGFNRPPMTPLGKKEHWPLLRESQTKALSLPNTGMASAIDLGIPRNIHPWRKKELGERLAAEAKRIAYGQDIVSIGPMYKKMEIKADKVIISFANTGSGLITKNVVHQGYKISKDELKGFIICGKDKVFKFAEVKIEGNTVIVSSNEVKNPVAVRYAWANFPLCNLYNKEGFPTNPFRTDK